MRIHTRNARQYGFTLLEVLVTVIIMTIGMLGVAGLQLASMRSNHSAYLRTQATIAAYSLIDRMRADPAEFNGKRFNTTSGDTPQSFQNWVYDLERIGLQDNIGDAQGEDSDIVIGEVNCSDDDENICLEGTAKSLCVGTTPAARRSNWPKVPAAATRLRAQLNSAYVRV